MVREDPNKKGLLYAGTEFGIFISRNGGENWESFQQNLPITPITDLKVHRNDIVLSTMGRSFWILDRINFLHHDYEVDEPYLVKPSKLSDIGIEHLEIQIIFTLNLVWFWIII